MAEWDRYKFEVGKGHSQELDIVRHVVHVPTARRIVEDGKIKASLIYDESKLNKSRISVAWVSANTWGLGSIYGTVEFQFSWADLVKDQKLYWVEVMTGYKPHAYRLMLSKREHTPDLMAPYDPAKEEGPLRLKDGKYYWNGEFTSEFMIEEDLSLDRCNGLTFVSHHKEYCRTHGNGCNDRQTQPPLQRTGARVLAYVLGISSHVLDKHLTTGTQPFTELDTAYSGLETILPHQVNFSGAITSDSQCQNVVRGALVNFGADQLEQARKLLALISSRDNYLKALKAIVRAHFKNPEWEPSAF